MTNEQLHEAIDKVLLRWQDEERELHPSWIAHEICSKHNKVLPKNAHGDFWYFTGYSYIREHVRKRINVLFDMVAETSRQMYLPDYEHLQSHYVVKRGDERIGVPTDQLSDEELDALAAMHEAMAAACTDHAIELRRYKKERRQLARKG